MTEDLGRILIVDDEAETRRYYQEVLEGAGYACDVAADGQAAFQRIGQVAYRLIILDIEMPGWNGLEAIRSLDLTRPDMRVLVVSGGLNAKVTKQLQASYCVDGWLSKPVQPGELRESVRAVLER